MLPNITLKEKDKKIAVIAGFVVLCVVDLVFIFGWQIRSLMSNYALAQERSQQIQSMEADVANKQRYEQELDDFTQKLDAIKNDVTEEADIPVLMENISTLATTIGVKIQQIRPVFDIDRNSERDVVSINDEKFGIIGIRILAEAGFHHLGTFIASLESKGNLFRLASIEIDANSRNYLMQGIRLSLNSAVRLAHHEAPSK